MSKNQMHLMRNILIGILILILGMGAATGIYLSVYYHADEDAVAAAAPGVSDNITVVEQNDALAFIPDDPFAGLIFYQGAKVDETAYAPLMRKLAEQGVLCVLPHLTANFAFLDINAANGVEEAFPDVKSWYIGGHSMGGVAACMYAQEHPDKFDGIILFASYSSVDISDTGLRVLSIYGSEDEVLSKKEYDNSKKNLPSDFEEVVIPGGCHAYFGNYGKQKGDGTPTITREEQQQKTCDAILDFLSRQPMLINE